MSVITIERKVLEKNDAIAQSNRALLARHDIFAVNLVSSPGAGKTSLIESTLQHLAGRLRVAVVEGDVQTDLDAQRVARYQVPVVQIVTNGACHLEAQLVRDALSNLALDQVDCLIVENVGNLVCPAGFDLGEAMKVAILSVTEGDDKPLKYPAMFQHAAVLVVSKVDLLPYVQCDLARLKANALQVNPELRIFETSCTTGVGIPEWSSWLADASRPRGA